VQRSHCAQITWQFSPYGTPVQPFLLLECSRMPAGCRFSASESCCGWLASLYLITVPDVQGHLPADTAGLFFSLCVRPE